LGGVTDEVVWALLAPLTVLWPRSRAQAKLRVALRMVVTMVSIQSGKFKMFVWMLMKK
jgi:hypothetical protein